MPRRVLFLDDSALIRAAASRALSKRGVPFETACSLREAFEVRQEDISAALLDIELEDGEGTAVAAWLRESAPGLPIAFLTGGAEDGILRRAVEYGPVFAKSDVDRAIAWAAAHASQADESDAAE